MKPTSYFFQGRYSKCPRNKIVHNFLRTNPNGMNQSFSNRQKYNLWGKNSKNEFQIFANFFVAPSPLFWAYLGINFVPEHRLKKNYIPMKLISFSIFIKSFKKSGQKFSPYLPKISFVPHRDNGPLGVKFPPIKEFNLTRYPFWHSCTNFVRILRKLWFFVDRFECLNDKIGAKSRRWNWAMDEIRLVYLKRLKLYN